MVGSLGFRASTWVIPSPNDGRSPAKYGIIGIPGLVNVYKKNDGKIHKAMKMGKSAISTGPWLQVRKLFFFTRGYIMLWIFSHVLGDTGATHVELILKN